MTQGERKTTQVRRVEIAEAVLHLIAEDGIASLSTATLAKRVGVSTGALFRHFASWTDIYAFTVAFAVDQMEATFPDEQLAPDERIFQLARNRIGLFSMNPGIVWLFRSNQAQLTVPPDAAAQISALKFRSQAYLSQAIQEGLDQGIFNREISASAILTLVMGVIQASASSTIQNTAVVVRQREKGCEALAALERLLKSPHVRPIP